MKVVKFKSVISMVLLGGVSLYAAQQETQERQTPQKQSTDSILVEAYLVHVSNTAMAGAGSAALPNKDGKESVSITKLLWCMKDPNSGKVADMARVICRAGEEAKSVITKTMYIKHSATQVSAAGHPIESITYQAYDTKSEIFARSRIHEDSSIGIELSFRYEGLDGDRTDEPVQAPPAKLAYSFDSVVMTKPNQPMIVGGMQNGDSSMFLVVRAEILK